MVGKRSLKRHKAVLFLFPRFNQNRQKSNTNPQLNFLQVKYWKKKKKKQDRGTHLWQQAHQQPLFCICSIINLICQIWFLSVLLKSWYTIKKAHIVNHREWWQFSSLVKEKRERQILQCAAFTFCTIWIFVTCITLEKQRGLYNFIPFKHYGPNLQPAWNAAYPLK